MGPFPGYWLAARIADFTPDLQVLLSWGSTAVSFPSRQSFSVNFFHVCLGLPAPRLPSICISYAVLIAPLERATCPNQRSLLSLKMRSRSSSWSFASSSLDLTLATSSGLILQICLITQNISLNWWVRRYWGGSFENSQSMFWLRNKKYKFPLCTLNLRPAVPSVRLKPGTSLSQVAHSTNEPLRYSSVVMSIIFCTLSFC